MPVGPIAEDVMSAEVSPCIPKQPLGIDAKLSSIGDQGTPV